MSKRTDLIAVSVPGALSESASNKMREELAKLKEVWNLKYPIVLFEQGAVVTNLGKENWFDGEVVE